jgi:hypothetical protein
MAPSPVIPLGSVVLLPIRPIGYVLVREIASICMIFAVIPVVIVVVVPVVDPNL